MKKNKIFICGMSTECCSYSTLTQNKEDFEIISNQKLLKHIDFNFAQYKNFNIIPNKFYRSVPGGPINKNFFINTNNVKISILPKIMNNISINLG